jgi:hypothetical protein
MPHINSNRRKPAIAVLVLLLASLVLAACGGSSSSSSSSNASASASASTTGGAGSTGPRSGRFAAVRECLAKNGITLPKRAPGTGRPPGAGGFLGGGAGRALPKGVTRAQYEAALKKCGGNLAGRERFFNGPARIQALTKFAECMRQNGVNLPAPNTSGNGPIFDTKGLNTSSTVFRTAEAKCQSELSKALPGRVGGGGAPPGAGPGGAAPTTGAKGASARAAPSEAASSS